jgi:S-DNA-T family DNA segregation ATPase FtsK/SpoIIIE
LARKKTSKKSNLNNEIIGITLITFGILILFSIISVFFTDISSGKIGQVIRKILIAVFGIGSYIFPFLIIFIGFCFIVKKGKIGFNKKFYGINIFIINTLLFIQMLSMEKFYTSGDMISGIKSIYSVDSVLHGGIISYLIVIPLLNLFGNVGSYIILSSIYIISIILIFQISLYDVFSDFMSSIKQKKRVENKGENKDDGELIIKDDMEVNDDALIACEGEKKGFIKSINDRIKIIDFIKPNDIDSNTKTNNKDITINQSSEDKKDTLRKNNPKGRSIEDEVEITKKLEREIEKNSLNFEEDYNYKYPDVNLLKENESLKSKKRDKKELLNNAGKLQETLASFGVNAKVIQVTKGPSVTRFEIQPEAGVKVSKIVNLADDIALNLASSGIRIEAPIPGKSAVGIEVPNKDLTPVFLREVIESKEFLDTKNSLAFCLGKDIGGNCVVGDLAKMPHVLVAGATGSGKSVCINSLIISLLYKYSPDEVKLLLVDPKVVELNVYNGIPHLLIPVVTEAKKAAGALNWAVNEMTKRYKAFADNGVRNIEGYNELVNKGIIGEKMPWIVIIIDELADLMMVCPKDVEDYIARLAQMARAAGMHLVIATQRPSVDVITGMIKANIPSRISFAVSSQIDSRTILDSSGAEKLLGKGDMLFYPVGAAKPVRIQGAFISETEVEEVVEFIKQQRSEVNYKDDIMEEIDNNVNGKSNNDDVDELLSEAIEFVIESGHASTSMLQRKFKIGYNRAARIMDQMEERQIISGRNGSKPRQVLVGKDEI